MFTIAALKFVENVGNSKSQRNKIAKPFSPDDGLF
jgi:hypothetical protein